MLEEKVSKKLGIKYIALPASKTIICENGVVFTYEENKSGLDIAKAYEERSAGNNLYDYAYAKTTGLLRRKRGTRNEKRIESNQSLPAPQTDAENTETTEVPELPEEVTVEKVHKDVLEVRESNRSGIGFAVWGIVMLLTFTSVISMYISTLHTATYLFDYVDMFSAWLMSASITAYNATAFEVSIMFKANKRMFLSVIFILLWVFVTAFSMATTISVFYDQFNFTEMQVSDANKESDANKLALELLQKKEATLRESIDFKKKDIEYRQEHDYATTAVRNELTALEKELQENMTEQQKVLMSTPDIVDETVTKKETLFAFLGRTMGIEGGILEFIMSTLSAVFINLVCPSAIIAITELTRKKKE